MIYSKEYSDGQEDIKQSVTKKLEEFREKMWKKLKMPEKDYDCAVAEQDEIILAIEELKKDIKRLH